MSQACISMKQVISKSRALTANSTLALKREVVEGEYPNIIGDMQFGASSVINKLILSETLTNRPDSEPLIKLDENGHPILRGMT